MVYQYIVAGNVEEYRAWRDKLNDYDMRTRYVHDPIILKGLVNPHGKFIGSWIKHPKIKEILLQLNVSTHEHNPGLEQAILEYHNHVSLLN